MLWSEDDLSYLGLSLSGLGETSAGRPLLASAATPAGPGQASFSGRAVAAGVAQVSGSDRLDSKNGDVKLQIINKYAYLAE